MEQGEWQSDRVPQGLRRNWGVLSHAPGEIEKGHYPWGPSWTGTIRFSLPQRNLKTGGRTGGVRTLAQGSQLKGGQSMQGER